MPRFACPVCKTIIHADDEQRGAVLACASCGKKIRVPPKPGAERAPASASRPEEARRAAAPAARKEAADMPPRTRPDRAGRDEDSAGAPGRAPRGRKPPRRGGDEVDSPGPPPRAADHDSDVDDDGQRDQDGDGKVRRRKESGTVAAVGGVISGGLGLLCILLFILIISGRGPRWLMDFIEARLVAFGIHPLLAVGITAVVCLIPFGLWMLVTLKGGILEALPDEIDFKATTTDKYPELNLERLSEQTEEFKQLGFEPLMDYTVTTELDYFPSGFARLLVNEQAQCYAEINQGFTPDGEAVPMRCLIVSHLDDDWSLMTTDRTPTKENYLMRRPRGVWRSLPDKTAEELFAHHKKMRRQMTESLEVDVVEPSEKAYLARARTENRERKEVVRSRWTLGILLEFLLFERNPKYEWRGDWV